MIISFWTNLNDRPNYVLRGAEACGVYYNGIFFPGWRSSLTFYQEMVKPILKAVGLEIIREELPFQNSAQEAAASEAHS